MPKDSSRLPKSALPASSKTLGALDNLMPRSASAGEIASYISDFTGELSSLAKHARLDLLAYMLEMAQIEAARLSEDSP